MEEKNKKINEMNARELRLEISRLNECLAMKDSEISRLQDTIERLVALESGREDILIMQKKATEVLDGALAEADRIVGEARKLADKIVGKAEESIGTDKNEIGILPGSRELVISDDLFVMGSIDEDDSEAPGAADQIISELFGKKDEQEQKDSFDVNEHKWIEIFDDFE